MTLAVDGERYPGQGRLTGCRILKFVTLHGYQYGGAPSRKPPQLPLTLIRLWRSTRQKDRSSRGSEAAHRCYTLVSQPSHSSLVDSEHCPRGYGGLLVYDPYFPIDHLTMIVSRPRELGEDSSARGRWVLACVSNFHAMSVRARGTSAFEAPGLR